MLLIDRDRDDNDDETHQHDAVQWLGQQEDHQDGTDEPQQHRLADGIQRGGDFATGASVGAAKAPPEYRNLRFNA